MTQLEKYEAPSETMISRWERTANILAKSSMVPERYKDKPGDIVAVAFTAHSLGLDLNPYTLQRFYCPKSGTVAMDAQMHARMADMHGWDLWFGKSDSQSATVYLQKRYHGPGPNPNRTHEYTYTIEDARTAGLANKDAWKGYPKVMLAYKAVTHLVRRVCPQVLMGVPNLYDEPDDPFAGEAATTPAAVGKTALIAAVKDAGLGDAQAIDVARDAWAATGWGSDPVDVDALNGLIKDTLANLPTGEIIDDQPAAAPVPESHPDPDDEVAEGEIVVPEEAQASLLDDEPERPF